MAASTLVLITCIDIIQLFRSWIVGGQVAPINTARGSLAAVALNGMIYALGGGQPRVSLSSTEIFDPAINAWMPGARFMCVTSKTLKTGPPSLPCCTPDVRMSRPLAGL